MTMNRTIFKLGYIILAGIFFLLFSSCEKDILDREIYQKPEWLSGKLYTQISGVENMKTFTRAIERIELDTLIDRSGYYTIFAPNDEAFGNYLASNNYPTVEDIPLDILEKLVKYHIVQNGWSRSQLQSLDIEGWIDPDSRTNNEPRGYKRQTILKEDNKKYFVAEKFVQGKIETKITNESSSNSTRIVYNDSRKYVPIYFDKFLSIAEISASDYSYFFDNDYMGGNLYYADGKLNIEEEQQASGQLEVKGEYFAENGFIYEIDRVVEPLPNAEQLLEYDYDSYSYSQFLGLIHLFSKFTYNEDATLSQAGADEGLEVENLYNLRYPSLVFDIQEEITSPSRNYNPSERYTIRYHFGLLAPTDQALNELVDDVITSKNGLPHWPSFANTPLHIKRMILNAHMSQKPIYESDLSNGFLNGEDDRIFVDPKNVVQNTMGSNSTFMGLSEAVLPRVFSSVAAPVYLRPRFSYYMYAVEHAGMLPAIKRSNANYSFFVLANETTGFSGGDSSLNVNIIDADYGLFEIESFDRSTARLTKRRQTELVLQLLNHVGASVPEGIARREFIPTLGGNFIVINNEEFPSTITGGSPSVYGYNGDSIIPVTMNELQSFEYDGKIIPDNGITYEIDGWLSFPTSDLFSLMSGYPKFYALLKKAKLVDDEVYYKLLFTSEGENYTLFVPTDEAIDAYNADTTHMNLNDLPIADLSSFLLYHMVKGSMIFTDGKQPESYYNTNRIDERSTIYNTVYSKMHIRPGIDRIEILDNQGNVEYVLEEEIGKTNIMAAENTAEEGDDIENYIVTSVIHEVDKVLEYED